MGKGEGLCLTKSTLKMRKMFWIQPFRCWDMLTIGNLSLALLWHIYRSLPQEVLSDEKIIYKLGKISVALPSLTGVLLKKGTSYSLDPERYASITNKAFPADRKSPVSSIFSACEQITELSETFRSIGRQIGSIGKFDSLVVPVIDIDLCLPEQAISLLFAIKNFICGETISFLICTDQEVLSRFLISLYDHSLTIDESRTTLLSLFDDWVYLPPPALQKLLQNMDRSLNIKEKEYIISVLNRSGLLGQFSDPSPIYRCFNRFTSFISSPPEKYSIEEYSLGLLLFLFGAYKPDILRSLAMLPNLKQFIRTFRTKPETTAASHRNRKQLRNPPSRHSIPLSDRHTPMKEYPHSIRNFTEINSVPLFDLFSAMPDSLTDAVAAQWIIKIIPFI